MFASVQFSYEFFVFESRLYSQIPVTLVITRAINVPSLSPDLATSVPVHRPLRKSVACTFASTFWFCWGQNASAAGHIRTCAQHVEKKRNENQVPGLRTRFEQARSLERLRNLLLLESGASEQALHALDVLAGFLTAFSIPRWATRAVHGSTKSVALIKRHQFEQKSGLKSPLRLGPFASTRGQKEQGPDNEKAR
ncbi:hypothetical protein AXG93_2557s1020 [Marchantia polymorpha subsp. ruderalis]|uniref:Uncharacterized protein n=1 Tax=Marchantia polymorpha subsp. ruderalis TaxID=1480154 RepID=A0A176WTH0_MARPO|nr:hypothetical protein AXG93_2557s1020 [Marchantia polymorpha subsp. ruderalis]